MGSSPDVVQLADWIVMLEDGQVSIEGSPEDLRQQAGGHLNFLTGIQKLEIGETR